MMPLAELIELIETRRGFSVSVTSDGDGSWSVVVGDGKIELRGYGDTFDQAWCSMLPIDLTPGIDEILNLASIWCDLHAATSEVEDEDVTERRDPDEQAQFAKDG